MPPPIGQRRIVRSEIERRRDARLHRDPPRRLASVRLGAAGRDPGDRHRDRFVRRDRQRHARLQRRDDARGAELHALIDCRAKRVHRRTQNRRGEILVVPVEHAVEQIGQQAVRAVVCHQIRLMKHPRIVFAAQHVHQQLPALAIEDLIVRERLVPIRSIQAVVFGGPVRRRRDVVEQIGRAARNHQDRRRDRIADADVRHGIVVPGLRRVGDDVADADVDGGLQEFGIREASDVRRDEVHRIEGGERHLPRHADVQLHFVHRRGVADVVEHRVRVGVAHPMESRFERSCRRCQRVVRVDSRRPFAVERQGEPKCGRHRLRIARGLPLGGAFQIIARHAYGEASCFGIGTAHGARLPSFVVDEHIVGLRAQIGAPRTDEHAARRPVDEAVAEQHRVHQHRVAVEGERELFAAVGIRSDGRERVTRSVRQQRRGGRTERTREVRVRVSDLERRRRLQIRKDCAACRRQRGGERRIGSLDRCSPIEAEIRSGEQEPVDLTDAELRFERVECLRLVGRERARPTTRRFSGEIAGRLDDRVEIRVTAVREECRRQSARRHALRLTRRSCAAVGGQDQNAELETAGRRRRLCAKRRPGIDDGQRHRNRRHECSCKSTPHSSTDARPSLVPSSSVAAASFGPSNRKSIATVGV